MVSKHSPKVPSEARELQAKRLPKSASWLTVLRKGFRSRFCRLDELTGCPAGCPCIAAAVPSLHLTTAKRRACKRTGNDGIVHTLTD
jgi:hypothetical protein